MICVINPGYIVAVPIIIAVFLLGGLLITAVVLFHIFLWWRVFSKAGFSGAFGLLIVVPFGSLVMLCVLAFSKWPTGKLSP